MKIVLAPIIALSVVSFAADVPSAKPIPMITLGKVSIPSEKMRRIWGELVSLDHEKLTFRLTGREESHAVKEVLS